MLLTSSHNRKTSQTVPENYQQIYLYDVNCDLTCLGQYSNKKPPAPVLEALIHPSVNRCYIIIKFSYTSTALRKGLWPPATVLMTFRLISNAFIKIQGENTGTILTTLENSIIRTKWLLQPEVITLTLFH